jgi:N-acetylneuraminic acid mutarotase
VKSCMLTLVVTLALLMMACGGNTKGSMTPPPTTYAISGTVPGLSGTGLVLQNNGGNNLQIGANGTFTFTNALTSGSTYNVTVLTQPSNPAQNCTVTNSSGTANANVTNIQVTCTTSMFTIGGTVSGLSGTGLVLQNNGGNNLQIGANGAFTFTAAITGGGAYNVTVLTQPSNPVQYCAVTNGTGTANANVTNVQVSCLKEWTWINGSEFRNQAGTYGTQGIAAPTNIPGGKNGAAAWTDAAGSFWLLGGYGAAADGSLAYLNDMWKYSAGEWTWVGGSQGTNPYGTYGTKGTPAPGNFPGGRNNAIAWTDSAGTFWLFGGYGWGATGAVGYLNDLWTYSAGEWTWISGSNGTNQLGTYGTLGVPALSNVPGARYGAAVWTDQAGNFWLFGGIGSDWAGATGDLNDLWKYSGGEWTWISGSNMVNQAGVYGTKGTAAPTNTPGARNSTISWVDSQGTFWLFGGVGLDSTASTGFLNDLWKYSGGQWTWVAGANLINQGGSYGTQGITSPSNFPSARHGAVGSLHTQNLLVFGGIGTDPVSLANSGVLNDLWTDVGGEWTWIAGSNGVNQPGSYGTQGVPALSNVPGARFGAVVWTDQAGNFWLFGGMGIDANGQNGNLNDLWRYGP